MFAAVTKFVSDFGQPQFDEAEIARIRPAQRLPLRDYRLRDWFFGGRMNRVLMHGRKIGERGGTQMVTR